MVGNTVENSNPIEPEMNNSPLEKACNILNSAELTILRVEQDDTSLFRPSDSDVDALHKLGDQQIKKEQEEETQTIREVENKLKKLYQRLDSGPSLSFFQVLARISSNSLNILNMHVDQKEKTISFELADDIRGQRMSVGKAIFEIKKQ